MLAGGGQVALGLGNHDAELALAEVQAVIRGALGQPVDPKRFSYPPGSRLVKTLLNPLKKELGLRFADLLKPDFRGAVLTTLAVDLSASST